MRVDFDELAEALSRAERPYLYGLQGITMEEQRAAVRLAKTLSGTVSVSKMLQPTLTFAGFSRFDLVLTAGGDLPGEIGFQGEVIREDRLLGADGWRALSSLFRESPIPGAEEFAALAETMKQRERAVFVWLGGRMDERTRRALMRFAGELYDLALIQFGACPNALGAYEVMLEECGSSAACFPGGETAQGDAFSDRNPSAYEEAGVIVRIGEADDIIQAEVPCYAVAETAADFEYHLKAVPAAGTHLRSDGVPITVTGAADGVRILDLLTELSERLAGSGEEVAG